MYLPEDPVLLVSMLNTYLRDRDQSLDGLFEDLDTDLSKEEVLQKIRSAGFLYDPSVNQFRRK